MIVSLVLLGMCLFFFFLCLKCQRPKNFPPGPAALPILGNLLNLSLHSPVRDLERLRKIHGNVYSLFIGPKPAVVINGLQAMKEAMVTKAADFAGRPQNIFLSDLDREGLVMADYGTRWKEHRRFALRTLRNFGMGKHSMEQRILAEIQYTVETMVTTIGTTFSPQVLFHNLASNVLCQVMFGTRYDYDDSFIKVVIQCFKETSKIINGPWSMLYYAFPLTRNLPLPFTKAFQNVETCKKLITHRITEHKQNRVLGQPRDFLDCYLDKMDKRGDDSSSFCQDALTMIIGDILLAGTNTTSNTLLTGFLYLSNYFQSITLSVCAAALIFNSLIWFLTHGRAMSAGDRPGVGKYASYDDRQNMPYTQAVIHEVQRTANTVPLSVFHCTTKDTQLNGYSIPKGTMVIQNLDSVLKEEGQWKFPHKFNPENFLNDQGEFMKPEAFMPFSAGPRVCLGEGLARMELFLVTVTLLRRFKFTWPEDAGPPDYTPVFGVNQSPQPYRMKIQLRAMQKEMNEDKKYI